MKLRTLVVLCVLLVWAGVRPAHAQTISGVELNGTWSVFQLATPVGPLGNASVHTYRGVVTLNDAGTVVSGALDDNQQPVARTFDLAGTLSITPAGVIDGTLALDDHLGDTGNLDVHEARLLFGKHTIVGVATILGDPGLFTFVKHQPAPFALDAGRRRRDPSPGATARPR